MRAVMERRGSVTMVKLGGSLLTDKRGREALREAVVERLAREIAAARAAGCGDLVVGHGSGSFGHVAASEAGIGARAVTLSDPTVRQGVAAVQDAAARLHRRVIAALVAAGVPTFSWSPSSACVGRDGRLVAGTVEPLAHALDARLVPIVHGDVVLDRAGGATIASTEAVVRFLVPRLRRHGRETRDVLWLGETQGVLDAAGRVVATVDRRGYRALVRAVRPAAGTDVTGGMLLRLATARALARAGVGSSIFDGTVPGALQSALAGIPPAGTRFLADPPTSSRSPAAARDA